MTDFRKINVEQTHDGKLLQITLAGGKGNIIDQVMGRELTEALQNWSDGRHLRAILLKGEGKNFSFGASVEEHAPEHAPKLLEALHQAIMEIVATSLPVICAIRGACLGGGLELAIPCHRILASPDARLGLPEITLGMYAPAGSLLLPVRVRRFLAEDMLLTGRIIEAEEALREGLIDQISDDPVGAAIAWFEEWLLPRSAMALRFATRAARYQYTARINARLHQLEERFVQELLQTLDAQEGLRSFAEKRKPVWVDA